MDRSPSPILSIVTVTYNDLSGLSRTLKSLLPLAESRMVWELIIVDSSPEKNSSIISDFSSRAPLLHLTLPAQGIYHAMNSGLSAASGRYIWFLNGGDILSSAAQLETSIAVLEKEGADLGINTVALMRNGLPYRIARPRWGLVSLLGINRICHQAVVYRRKVFSRIGGYEEKYRLAADYAHHLNALNAGLKVVPIHNVIAHYDMSGQSSNFQRALKEFSQVHFDLRSRNMLSFSLLHRLAYWFESVRLYLLMKARNGF